MPRFPLPLRWVCLVLIGLAMPVQAVVISTRDGQGNTIAPTSNPYWSNVAQLSGASAVYLGNRWVITANHVSDGPVRFINGTTVQPVPGSDVTFTNPVGSGLFGTPDLRMFRVAEDPGLPSLGITGAVPAAATRVMMIGAGQDRGRTLTGFSVASTTSGNIWRQAPLPLSSVDGFRLESTAQMRWGYNTVDTSQLTVTNGTLAFHTTFDPLGVPFEAQAVTGDSGGGVFQRIDGTWQLAGIMDTIQTLTGQPANTVIYGDQTYSVNLSSYRDQILSVLNRPDATFQNQLNFFDVDRSGSVTDADAVLIEDALNKTGAHLLTGLPGANDPLLDVDGNGFLTADDAKSVRGFLLFNGESLSAQAGLNFVPEPDGLVLAGIAAFFVLYVWARAARRGAI